MNGIRLVIIDLDMTLVDTARRCYEVLMDITGVNSFNFEEFMTLYYDGNGIRRGLANMIGDRAFDYGFWRECWLRYVEGGRYGSVMPSAVEVLRRLRGEGRVVTIATGREIEGRFLVRELETYGILNLVDGYMTLGDLGPQYGKDELLRRMVTRYNNGNFKGSVYVTDHPRDITICREIGLPSIGVLNRWNRGLRADKVINNLEELPEALRELEASIN